MDSAPPDAAPEVEGAFFDGLVHALIIVAPFWAVVAVAAWRSTH